MKLVACCKFVLEAQDIQTKPDRSLDLSRAQWKIGQYDLNAIEAGLKLSGSEDKLILLAVGGEEVENSKLRKSALSHGGDELVTLRRDNLDTGDSLNTARLLKAAIERMGDIDLVLCGEGSEDLYAQSVGNLLGALLGWPTVNGVCQITKSGSELLVERSLEQETEVLTVRLPAVLSVTADANLPHIPGMRDILMAGKKPVTAYQLEMDERFEADHMLIKLTAPEQTERRRQVWEDSSPENLEAFAKQLRWTLRG